MGAAFSATLERERPACAGGRIQASHEEPEVSDLIRTVVRESSYRFRATFRRRWAGYLTLVVLAAGAAGLGARPVLPLLGRHYPHVRGGKGQPFGYMSVKHEATRALADPADFLDVPCNASTTGARREDAPATRRPTRVWRGSCATAPTSPPAGQATYTPSRRRSLKFWPAPQTDRLVYRSRTLTCSHTTTGQASTVGKLTPA